VSHSEFVSETNMITDATKSRYIGEIDTLRALAVLLVVLFHAYPTVVPGGYIGVDVFFVISGFVIARAYLPDLLARRTSLGSFWAARFRRLSPALLLMLAVVTVLALIFVQPDKLLLYGKSLLAQPLYIQNFVFWNEGDYFQSAQTKPLLHTWSLAVEEQFYLLFGLAVLIFRFAPRLFGNPPIFNGVQP
jgi:peptidoglycan/LPS O-acetylase OafA/YrhL